MILELISSVASQVAAVRSMLRCNTFVLTMSCSVLVACTQGTTVQTTTNMQPVSARLAVMEVIKPIGSCMDLTSFSLTDIGGAGSRITAATLQVSSRGTPVCNVAGVLSPSIRFTVQLPTQTWTQRYLQLGCGGLCGRISNDVGAADGCVPLSTGAFVIAATDMGHQDQDGSFGDDPQLRADFAHRAQHLTAIASKALIRAFYGQAQAYAYFTGCSDGGREALIEAQRYPDDFDGIIAGASALNFQVQNALFHAWQARANTGNDGKAILVAARLPILHNAVVAACDGLDGLTDGLISNPIACRFDLAVVQCPADSKDSAHCLTAAEVNVVRELYDGPRDPRTGARLTVGGPQLGSELAWAGVYVPDTAEQPIFSENVSSSVLNHLAFEINPRAKISLADMHFDLTMFDRLRAQHLLYDATNPDLSAFRKAGGKLIMWHGWSDPHISPINSIAYYTAVEQRMGKVHTEDFARLYLFPGMYHCANGEGPSQVDLLTPMMRWVEGGTAPDRVVADQPERGAAGDFGAPTGADATDHPPFAMPIQASAKTPVNIVRSRPVYPWPYMASYEGAGDATKASSFVRGATVTFQMPEWAGSDFFAPYVPLER